MQGELVNFDVAAFAGQGIRVRGQAVNAPSIGELEDMSGELVFRVQDNQADVGGGDVQDSGSLLTIFEVESGLELVPGGDPDVELSVGGAGFHDGVERIGRGAAALAAFLPDAQGIWIVNPFQLSWQEPGALGKNVFGADRCRWVPLGAVRCLNREIVAAAIGTDRHHRDWRSGTDRHLRIQ